MHKVTYTGTVFYTGDRIAAALLEYAAALARADTAATVTVPALTSAGEAADVEVLIGPASQLASEPFDSIGWAEVEDEATLEELQRLTSDLAPRYPSFEPPFQDDDEAMNLGR